MRIPWATIEKRRVSEAVADLKMAVKVTDELIEQRTKDLAALGLAGAEIAIRAQNEVLSERGERLIQLQKNMIDAVGDEPAYDPELSALDNSKIQDRWSRANLRKMQALNFAAKYVKELSSHPALDRGPLVGTIDNRQISMTPEQAANRLAKYATTPTEQDDEQ